MFFTSWWKGARRGEEWLKGKYTEYGTYQKRVRKLIPFIYQASPYLNELHLYQANVNGPH